MAKGNNEKLDDLQSTAVDRLINFFNGPKAEHESKHAQKMATLAIQSLGRVAGIKATERARDGMQLVVLKHISKDPAEFEKYLKASMPHLNPVKMLES